jgi:predicted DNA-binding transcriptional regulator YafY
MYAILSHGRKLSVLAPEEFRMRIMEEVEGMKGGYEG